ncbi:MAG: hypothetical protein A2583_09105 [Bdellovibrionales bacterium RIFOXYD1_FULL_53_11]|nr:MAG: hypothetical protein A2583_09105 [Bdellovibrionales bacterium RIFOXYD1_FULL_53_11]
MGQTDPNSVIGFIIAGGFAMYPLLICSLAVWVVIFERLWRFRRMSGELAVFHEEAMKALLAGERQRLRGICEASARVPTARIVGAALERMDAKDARLRSGWFEAMDRKRLMVNQDLRRYFWVLGTIGSSAPFIGLFGTVVGILRSFRDMARAGSGGFAVVASGISESLIATAAGIVVAVVAVIAYNAFQTKWGSLVLGIRLHSEEIAGMLRKLEDGV